MHTTVYVKLVSTTNPKKSTLLKLEGLAAQSVAEWMLVENYSIKVSVADTPGYHSYEAKQIIPSGVNHD